MYIHVYTYSYARIYMHIYVYIFTQIYIYTHKYIQEFTQIYIHTIRTLIHIHVPTPMAEFVPFRLGQACLLSRSGAPRAESHASNALPSTLSTALPADFAVDM